MHGREGLSISKFYDPIKEFYEKKLSKMLASYFRGRLSVKNVNFPYAKYTL